MSYGRWAQALPRRRWQAPLHPKHHLRDLPIPLAAGRGAAGDPLVEEIAQAARTGSEAQRWLNPEGASEAELKKRTLTNLYNAVPCG